MEEIVKQNGGRRPGAGRKPKAAEIALAQQMDKVAPCEQVLNALYHKVLEGDTAAIKLWLNYRLGMPVQGVYRDWETDRKSTRLNSSDRL